MEIVVEITAGKYENEPVRHPALEVVDLAAEGRAVTEKYRNMGISKVNDSCLRLAVFDEEYLWYYHPTSDELFIVIEGCLTIDFEAGRELKLTAWQSVTVPSEILHRTRAEGRTVNLCFEKLGAETVFVGAPKKRQKAFKELKIKYYSNSVVVAASFSRALLSIVTRFSTSVSCVR